MIPQKSRPFFTTTFQKKDGDNSLIEGILTCCNSHDFEILVIGKIKHNMFTKMHLLPNNNQIVFEVRCKKCGKIIPIFDSSCDGYEHCGTNQHIHTILKSVACNKCHGDGFGISIRYEYPNIQELEHLEITEIDNAFTWIWISLECNKCGTKYRNFIDFETG